MNTYPEELINFYNQNKDLTAPVHTNFQDSYNDVECAYYPIKFNFDSALLLKECQDVDDLFFLARGYKSEFV